MRCMIQHHTVYEPVNHPKSCTGILRGLLTFLEALTIGKISIILTERLHERVAVYSVVLLHSVLGPGVAVNRR